VLRWDLEGRVTFLNHFGLQFFGYGSDELVGRSIRPVTSLFIRPVSSTSCLRYEGIGSA
jgi:PAS domain-containing protein